MPKFPEPPVLDALRKIPVEIQELPAGTEVARIFFAGGDHPTTQWHSLKLTPHSLKDCE